MWSLRDKRVGMQVEKRDNYVEKWTGKIIKVREWEERWRAGRAVESFESEG